MSSLVRRHGRDEPRAWRAVLWVLLAVDLALLVVALVRGGVRVMDGSGSVTDGWTISAGILATLAIAAALGLLRRLKPRLLLQARVFALGAQALHAAGHLLGFYYDYRWYDDVLHAGLVFLLGLLFVEAFRALPTLGPRLRPLPLGVAVAVACVAAAGAWEIFEFLMDVGLGTREQDDLVDTMMDMLDGAVGAVAAGALGARTVARARAAKALRDARSDELLD